MLLISTAIHKNHESTSVINDVNSNSYFYHCATAFSKPDKARLPKGTIIHGNIPYNNDTLKKHLLDIYVPADAKGKVPLVVLIHGGGWIGNDKYADMGYMPNTVAAILNNGMAVASIDYRFATQAVFPAILQDCNKAVSFLYDNADKYGLDKNRHCIDGFFRRWTFSIINGYIAK